LIDRPRNFAQDLYGLTSACEAAGKKETQMSTLFSSLESIRREYPPGPIPASHAITYREGKVLLVKRAHQPSKERWGVPGGMIELGETIYAAAQRELREECGIEVRIEKVVNVVDNIVLDESGHIRFHYVVIYLLAQYVSGVAHPNSDASEVCWVTREELDTLEMHPLAQQIVRQTFSPNADHRPALREKIPNEE
jgi:ADP-ribose pyrophosphatase